MNKLFTLITAVLLTATVWAQSPAKMSYQAVLRDASNNLVTNQSVGMRISILQASADGKSVYVETQIPVTNANGLVSIVIGDGTVVSGTFSTIDWANGPYYIKTETDPAGGTNYTITGTSQLLSVPYALFAGHTKIDSIHVSKITGLLGQGQTMIFPVIIDNYTTLDINGLVLNEKVVIISSIGHETERISVPIGINNGDTTFTEKPGFSMEYPIVFETENATDVASLISWFDNPLLRSGSIIYYDLAGVETGRWNFSEYILDGYEPGIDGRTRFTMIHDRLPNSLLHFEYLLDFGSEHSYNPVTDKLVEVSGVSHADFTPAVEVDNHNRTITLTMDYLEGQGLKQWAYNTVTGIETGTKSMSIIETTDGTSSTEISRKNYFECIPIKYEHIYGFGLNIKLKARIVIAFGYWQIGL